MILITKTLAINTLGKNTDQPSCRTTGTLVFYLQLYELVQSLENLELPYKHEDKPKFYLTILYLCAFLRQICLCSSVDMLISALFIIIAKIASNPMPIKNRVGTLLCLYTKKHNTVIKKNDQKIKSIG